MALSIPQVDSAIDSYTTAWDLISEWELLDNFPATGSGFDRLKHALSALRPEITVVIEVGPLDDILKRCLPAGPVLVAHQNNNGTAHCVVVSAFDGKELTIHDPALGQPDTRRQFVDEFRPTYAGDCATLHVPRPPEQ